MHIILTEYIENKIILFKTGVATMEDNSMIQIDKKDGIATAEIVNFCNDLFDSVNGIATSDIELRCEVTANSAHHAFWTNAKHVLRNMLYRQSYAKNY